jgi:large subunit ribosomal protein L4
LRNDIVHRVVMWQQKNNRTTLYKAKDRQEVSGGGKKPWRQKGTGRARHGSTRSPIWKGGGQAHGAVFRDWSVQCPKKIRRFALRVALSAKLRDRRLVIVDDFALNEAGAQAEAQAAEGAPAEAQTLPVLVPKTRTLASILLRHSVPKRLSKPVLMVGGDEIPEGFGRACRNLHLVHSLPAFAANVKDIVHADKLILSKSALELLTMRLNDNC